MTDLNDRIRDALRADADEALAELVEEPDLFEQVLETFRGRSRALVLMSIAIGILFMAAAVFCLVRFFQVAEVRSMIAWALGFFFCLSAVMGMKVWYWMELQKNAITREIKRLELQVSRLARER
ncbi:MAG: DUF6768 family protein [Planctomycetota bacterium]|jgi:uncharacterized membrane protein YciS (DUF1049 family)